MGQGVVIADGPPAEVLERRLALLHRGGARHSAAPALLPEDGARLIRCRQRRSWRDELAGRLLRACSAVALAAGFAWYERAARRRRVLALVGDARGAGGRRAARVRRRSRTSSRPPTSCCSPATRSAGCRASRSARWPRSCRTSSSARGRGRRGRWSAGAAVGVAGAALARALQRAASPSRLPAGGACAASPGSRSAPGWTSTSGRWPRTRTSTPTSRVSATLAALQRRARGGNVVFCLLIGPAFVRALRRYRRRFEVRWTAPAGAAAALALAVLLRRSPAAAGAASPADARRALPARAQNARRRLRRRRAARPRTSCYSGWAGARAGVGRAQPARRAPPRRPLADRLRRARPAAR